jgi:hypothetical protein
MLQQSVSAIASTIPKYTCFLNFSFRDASKYVKMAPSIKAASKPSLKIIENDEENAIAGATTPIPDTNRSDSSNPFLSYAILETI